MGISQVTAGQTLTALDINQLPVVVSYLATGTGGASSTSETVIGTFTIPAGDPTFPGGYWFYVHGIFTEAGSPNLIIQMRSSGLSGTKISFCSGTVTAGAAGIFDIVGWMGFEAIGAGGSFGNFSQTIITALTIGLWNTDAVAIDTTVSETLVVTATFNASNASNSATTKFGALYRL
jgi:hypothetical protein